MTDSNNLPRKNEELNVALLIEEILDRARALVANNQLPLTEYAKLMQLLASVGRPEESPNLIHPFGAEPELANIEDKLAGCGLRSWDDFSFFPPLRIATLLDKMIPDSRFTKDRVLAILDNRRYLLDFSGDDHVLKILSNIGFTQWGVEANIIELITRRIFTLNELSKLSKEQIAYWFRHSVASDLEENLLQHGMQFSSIPLLSPTDSVMDLYKFKVLTRPEVKLLKEVGIHEVRQLRFGEESVGNFIPWLDAIGIDSEKRARLEAIADKAVEQFPTFEG